MCKKFLFINVGLSFLISFFLFFSAYRLNAVHLFQDDDLKRPLSVNKFNNFINPDALHYYIMGQILLEHGVFSRDLDNPEDNPDILRTPAYPFLLALIGLITKKAIMIYIVQSILYILAIVYLMKMCFLITKNSTASFVAGLFMALNISCYSYIFFSMAEILYIFLTVASLYYFVLMCKNLNEAKFKSAVYAVIMLAIFTGVNVLTRNAVKMMLIIYLFSIAFFLKVSLKKKLFYVFLLLAVYFALIFPWMYRNHKLFGTWKLSNSQEINLVYLTGAGTYGMKHKVGINESRDMISREYNLPSYFAVCNPWSQDNQMTVLEMSKKLKEKIPNVLFKYPYHLTVGAIVGLIKGHLTHSTQDFAAQWDVSWIKPNLSLLAKGNVKSFLEIYFQTILWFFLCFFCKFYILFCFI